MKLHVRCPDSPGEIVGCGHGFEAEPDFEGLFDCPNCGLFFKPTEADLAIGSLFRVSACQDNAAANYRRDKEMLRAGRAARIATEARLMAERLSN